MKKLPKFSSRAFLAPMAGVTDPAFRLLCKELGAGLVSTELVSIHAIAATKLQLVPCSAKERPVACQLFGSDLEMLKTAAKIISKKFDLVDYNMGCPAPKIVKLEAGAALLNHPERARKIFRVLVKNSARPVTLKLRAGISRPDQFQKIVQIAEQEGIAMLTLHARTLKQGYSGKADWNLIKELKQLVNIPVVGNGDITCPEDAKRMLDETGCDYVMVGRAAMNNPYLFTQINDYLSTGKYREISPQDKIKLFFRYLRYARRFKSIKLANIKMHAMNMSKSCPGSKQLRGKLLKVTSINEVKKLMEDFTQKV